MTKMTKMTKEMDILGPTNTDIQLWEGLEQKVGYISFFNHFHDNVLAGFPRTKFTLEPFNAAALGGNTARKLIKPATPSSTRGGLGSDGDAEDAASVERLKAVLAVLLAMKETNPSPQDSVSALKTLVSRRKLIMKLTLLKRLHLVRIRVL